MIHIVITPHGMDGNWKLQGIRILISPLSLWKYFGVNYITAYSKLFSGKKPGELHRPLLVIRHIRFPLPGLVWLFQQLPIVLYLVYLWSYWWLMNTALKRTGRILMMAGAADGYLRKMSWLWWYMNFYTGSFHYSYRIRTGPWRTIQLQENAVYIFYFFIQALSYSIGSITFCAVVQEGIGYRLFSFYMHWCWKMY